MTPVNASTGDGLVIIHTAAVAGRPRGALLSHGNFITLQHIPGLESPEFIEKYQKLADSTFYSIYGQTETSAIATMSPYSDIPGSAGKTIQLANVRLVDDNDQAVPVGEICEIAVNGPMVFIKDWNLPE